MPILLDEATNIKYSNIEKIFDLYYHADSLLRAKASSLEERIMEGAKLLVKDYYLPLPEALSEDEKLQMIYKINMERYLTKKPNEYREMLLEMIGLKN